MRMYDKNFKVDDEWTVVWFNNDAPFNWAIGHYAKPKSVCGTIWSDFDEEIEGLACNNCNKEAPSRVLFLARMGVKDV